MKSIAEQQRLLLEEIKTLKEENNLLKQKIKELEKEKTLRNLEDALKKQSDKKKGEIWPDKVGGWHLCGKCGKIVTNGQVCDCYFNKPPYNPTWPATPPIWCGTSNTSSL